MALLSCHLYSSVLKMGTGVNVILPVDRNPSSRKLPLKTVYLLHGLSDDYTCWLRYSNVESYALAHNFAIVMPEVQHSFYTDMKSGLPYFTYISQELPALCEEMFPLSTKREDRFVAGLSMGGHGALKCALTYPDRYAACGAFSSAIDIRKLFAHPDSSPIAGEIPAIYGEQISDQEDVFFLAQQAASSTHSLPKLFLSCGTEDSLYENNERFYQHVQSLGYSVKGYEAKAGHEWPFWDESIRQALDYFDCNTEGRVSF